MYRSEFVLFEGKTASFAVFEANAFLNKYSDSIDAVTWERYSENGMAYILIHVLYKPASKSDSVGFRRTIPEPPQPF